MPSFGVRVEDCESAREFFESVRRRLAVVNPLENPFRGRLKRVGRVYVLSLDVIWPQVYLISIVPFAVYFFLWSAWWLVVIGSFFLSIGLLWTPWFHYFLLRKGLRKAGYCGRVEFLGCAKCVRELVRDGSG